MRKPTLHNRDLWEQWLFGVKRIGKGRVWPTCSQIHSLCAIYLYVGDTSVSHSFSKAFIYAKAFMSGADFTEGFVAKMEEEIYIIHFSKKNLKSFINIYFLFQITIRTFLPLLFYYMLSKLVDFSIPSLYFSGPSKTPPPFRMLKISALP